MSKDKHKKNDEGKASQLGYHCWELSNLWQRKMREVLEPLGLTHVQLLLLKSLSELEVLKKHATQVDIAKHANCDKMMVSKVLRDLEKKKLLKRKNYHLDARAKLLTLTESAKPIIAEALLKFEAANEHFFEPLHNKQSQLEKRVKKLIRVNQGEDSIEEDNDDE
jgi:DNA-binding MarR family transcriptional regulator